MSSKKVSDVASFFVSPSAYVASKTSNTTDDKVVGIFNAGGTGYVKAAKDYGEGGTDQVVDAAKSGDYTDPNGYFHDMSGDIADPTAADQEDTQAAGYTARDRVRRLAMRASGRRSTIKVDSSAQPYSGEQKQLLGS